MGRGTKWQGTPGGHKGPHTAPPHSRSLPDTFRVVPRLAESPPDSLATQGPIRPTTQPRATPSRLAPPQASTQRPLPGALAGARSLVTTSLEWTARRAPLNVSGREPHSRPYSFAAPLSISR